jgi:hypothetical protein
MSEILRFPYTREDIPTFRDAFRQHIMPGFIPAQPLFPKSASVVTQGSCFAHNIAKTLVKIGVQATWLEVHEFMNSPLANRTYMEYVLAGKPVTSKNHKFAMQRFFDPEALGRLRAAMEAASVFIFTAGLAYSIFGANGDFYLVGQKDPDARWRLTSVDDNQAHIEAIISMARAVNPNLTIILTISPIPLIRDLGQNSVFVSDCLSKSVLRAAVGQVMALKMPGVHYWPSFDAIRWLGGHVGPVYGVEGVDQRHIGQSYIDVILEAFVEHFFIP